MYTLLRAKSGRTEISRAFRSVQGSKYQCRSSAWRVASSLYSEILEVYGYNLYASFPNHPFMIRITTLSITVLAHRTANPNSPPPTAKPTQTGKATTHSPVAPAPPTLPPALAADCGVPECVAPPPPVEEVRGGMENVLLGLP